MLTDLSWLQPGAIFPPPSEKARLECYRENERLFLSQHSDVWRELFRQLAAKYKKRNHDVETVVNYHQLLSKKTSDFVCSEPPRLETEGDTDQLVAILNRLGFNSKLYEAFLDVSRFGNGLLKLVGKGLSVASPLHWFPVVDPADIKSIVQHVIAYTLKPDANGHPTELYAEIHSAGRVETRAYRFDGQASTIGAPLTQEEHQTGLDAPAVQVLTNLTHSGSIFGVDDYGIINSIVARVMWRLHCAGTVLDKHSEPSMSGPESALQFDEKTGMWFVPLGNYFKRGGNDDPDIKYVTWDGNLESSFKELELLINQLYILTEMGAAFLEGGGGGAAQSGTALKLRMVSPRIKAQRLIGINAATVKATIAMLARVNGVVLDYDTLTIHWYDGLPKDDVEEVGTLTQATGRPIMSQYAAMKRMGLSDEEVEAELEQMREEQASNSPLVLGTVDQNAGNPAEPEAE